MHAHVLTSLTSVFGPGDIYAGVRQGPGSLIKSSLHKIWNFVELDPGEEALVRGKSCHIFMMVHLGEWKVHHLSLQLHLCPQTSQGQMSGQALLGSCRTIPQ